MSDGGGFCISLVGTEPKIVEKLLSIFFKDFFLHILRIFWNVCRSEFERTQSKTKFFVNIFSRKFSKSQKIVFAYVPEHLASFENKQLNLATFENSTRTNSRITFLLSFYSGACSYKGRKGNIFQYFWKLHRTKCRQGSTYSRSFISIIWVIS